MEWRHNTLLTIGSAILHAANSSFLTICQVYFQLAYEAFFIPHCKVNIREYFKPKKKNKIKKNKNCQFCQRRAWVMSAARIWGTLQTRCMIIKHTKTGGVSCLRNAHCRPVGSGVFEFTNCFTNMTEQFVTEILFVFLILNV